MSETRKVYIGRLIGRCVIFVICLFMYLFRRDFFTVLDGMNFFKEFSLLHLLWGVWVVDMTLQIIPIKNKVPLGSQKLFSSHFKPIREKINYEALRNYICLLYTSHLLRKKSQRFTTKTGVGTAIAGSRQNFASVHSL